MDDVKSRFLSNGIPYDDIDVEMIELLDVLNFRLGLKTQFCCFGHDINEHGYVLFDSCVTDEQIMAIANHLLSIDAISWGWFYKWVRTVDVPQRMAVNWMWESEYKIQYKTDGETEFRKRLLRRFVEYLRMYPLAQC